MEIGGYIRQIAREAKGASRLLRVASTAQKNRALLRVAALLEERRQGIRAANACDCRQAERDGVAGAMLDRLLLTDRRIDEMVRSVREISALEDPVGERTAVRRPAGFLLERVRVPIGVVAIIYESRPNVTADAACLCLKSGNACILRGGKEAMESGKAIAAVIREALAEAELPPAAVQYVERKEHEGVGVLVRQSDCVDLVVPRGGEELIRSVVEQATVPVIKHYRGNCHLYVDEHAELVMASDIVANSKLQRVGVCNALESLLVHASVAQRFLPLVEERLRSVELRGCERTRRILPRALPATEEDWAAEYLELKLSVKVVDSLEEAAGHIERYGSSHTDGIISDSLESVERFVALVDSAVVTVNASTRLSDGGVFGLGAEIGISTDRLHARGPMGVRELTTYKWVVRGHGTLRE